MTFKYLTPVIASILLVGCEPKVEDLQAFVEEIKQTTQVTVKPYPEIKKLPVFKYTAATLRNPFQRPQVLTANTEQSKQSNCLQPDFTRKKQVLESFGTDALSVTGFFTSMGQQWALIQGNDGSLHKAKAGDYLGLFYGRITSINNDTIFITELLPDGTGCWQGKEAKLIMSSKTGENQNV